MAGPLQPVEDRRRSEGGDVGMHFSAREKLSQAISGLVKKVTS
jgi:hypothetical protein